MHFDNTEMSRLYRKFNRGQREAMARHVAGVFRAHEGAIELKGRDAQDSLIDFMIKRAHAVGDMKKTGQAHAALVQLTVYQLLDKQHIVIEAGTAIMSARFMEKQNGVSRQLRGRDHKPRYDNGRRPRRKVYRGDHV